MTLLGLVPLRLLLLLPVMAMALPDFRRSPHVSTSALKRQVTGERKLIFASLGDSWASGVAWGDNAYDDNKNCLRVNHAYGVLLDKDPSWTPTGHELHFTACSGSQYSNIVEQANSQLSQAGKIDMATLTIGGNNHNFGVIMKNCIFTPAGFGYGDEWPSPNGLCGIAIQEAQSNLERNTYGWIMGTIRDLHSRDQTRGDPQFHLFLAGYAELFNPETTECDDWTFAPIKGPKLKKDIRLAINGLVKQINQIYAQVAKDNDGEMRQKWPWQPEQTRFTHFVDISPGFEKHRFCDQGHSYNDQFSSDDVWIWNRPGVFGVESEEKMSEEDWAKALSDTKTRTAHPKQAGHLATKDQILKAILEAKVPRTTGGYAAGQPSNSCQTEYKLLFNKFDIRGKEYDPEKLGSEGNGLLKQLKGCGAVTEWKFELTPNDCCYEWHASGHIIIGQKACMARAMTSAGGTGTKYGGNGA